jgi:hypothetical protein
MPITILDDHAYSSYLAPLPDPGIEASHLARVRFPGEDTPRRVYVKLYPENARGLVNEVTGHLLAEAAGLPVPTRSAVILVPKQAITDLAPWARRLRRRTLVGWCTEDMAAPSIKFHFALNPHAHELTFQKVVAELRDSTITPAVIALDDWIANVDRNLGNLLRLRKGDYLLIDHGRIFGGPDWSAASLADTASLRTNIVGALLGAHARTPRYRLALAGLARNSHATALGDVCAELLDWWSVLLEDADMEIAATFLDDRVRDDNICARYQVMQL